MSRGGGSQLSLSLLLHRPGNFEGGVPYRITVTAVSSWGLAPAPSVWRFREELGKCWSWRMGHAPGTLAGLDPLTFSPAPLAGPVLWRLQDAPPGTPAIAWGEVPRHQLRGHLTHYTLCVQSGTRPSVCMNGELHCPLPPAPSPPQDPPISLPHPRLQSDPFGSFSAPGKICDILCSLADNNARGYQYDGLSFDH